MWIGLEPPKTHFHLKVVYNLLNIVYLGVLFKWRFSFNYDLVYDFQHDHFSRFIDLINFVALDCTHFIVGVELLWRNRSKEIEQELVNICQDLKSKLGWHVNYKRIRRYSIAVQASLLIRITLLMAVTIYCFLVTTTSELLVYALYSEIVLMVRFSQFTLYTVMILAIYQELFDVSSSLINELRRPGFEESLESLLIADKLGVLQELHHQTWRNVRNIERNFQLSLTTILLKFSVDITVLPYWVYLNILEPRYLATQRYCVIEEFCKLMEIVVPCLICTRCDLVQRKVRSLFHHHISLECQNEQLKSGILRTNMLLGQERCQFSAGGFLIINNEMLGKFLFGVVSYIVICIQFRINYIANKALDTDITNITQT
ncbi:uncharacterized protein Dwil_GK12227 [Drosophila willistoni]|uniref:Gustatory receptor n=1 Tax=Drosophila willistoni TaxID=7260 RepID=B4N9Y8_DROWI|nr:uncharacterized protein Dwil_GK12227 [Drosophila willistoni]